MEIYFKIGEKLQIPNLSDFLNLDSQYFTIIDIYPGGMGYCLKLKNGSQIYAAKTIYSDFLKDNNTKDRFVFELKTWLTLSSINGIVEALLIININEIPCIISKWMDNNNLRSHMNKKEKKLFFNNILRIANTLNLVYKKYNIIHRDLKPENLLFDKNNRVFIADWGISKVIKSHIVNNDLTKISDNFNKDEIGKFLGTIQYSSPEQIKGFDSIDIQSDIYSLGCIMYEWETGNIPFSGKTIQEIVTKQLYEKPKEYSNLFNKSNYGIEKIVLKCLEKEPQNRYQNYEALIYDIKNVAQKCNLTNFDVIEDNYSTPVIGNNEIKKLLNNNVNNLRYRIIEQNDITKYINEALNLSSLGEYNKVIEILRPFYIQSLFKDIPDEPFVQQICINLSLAEKNIGNVESAIDIIRNIDFATIKPSEYFINLSQYYLLLQMYDLAETFCLEGLKQYRNDQDIIGNLIIALSSQKKFTEAIKYAKKRLDISINVNSLNEIATVYTQIAENIKNNDFINAIRNYKFAYNFLIQASNINPRALSIRYNIVNILFKLKKYEDSLNEIKKIIKLNDGKVTSISVFFIVRNYLWLGAFEIGLKYIDDIIEKISDNDKMKNQILRIRAIICLDGLSNLKGGRTSIDEKSEAFFWNIIDDKENRIYYDFEYLAQILTWKKDLETATNILYRGIKLYPDYWRFYMSLSYIYLLQNKVDLALKETNTALKLAPWREQVHSRLSEIYEYYKDKDNYYKHREEYVYIKGTKEQLYSQHADEEPDTTVTLL